MSDGEACERPIKVQVGTLEPGTKFYYFDADTHYEVERQGTMGTTVRPLKRVAKKVTDAKSGQIKTFTSEAPTRIVASESMVTPLP